MFCPARLDRRVETGYDQSMNYTYKQLGSGDIELLKKLLKVFGQAFKDIPTYQNAIPSNAYLTSLLAKPDFIVLVATGEDEIVGGLAAYQLQKFEQERSEIYIYDLAVDEAHRRKGIATRLIQELKNIAKNRDAYVIYVQADKEDLPAIKLYESLGKKEDVFHFDIPVK
ncbi:MAG TPA: AAC(3)-I family aminoglycoside N-acetyltransferase [Methylomirabilota bacterium]|nr:AAC(3)-I family aminoglycoside N-acetyltransferase [Methylomirabilota bacterium]